MEIFLQNLFAYSMQLAILIGSGMLLSRTDAQSARQVMGAT